MRRIGAIAIITVRSAVRSRVLLTLGLLLLATVVGLPLTIRGDGTIGGHVQILLRYSLGASFLLLGIAMVWAGCAAISMEVRDRQMHLVATKPIHPIEIWLGKWLGLLFVAGSLLAMAGAGVYGLLRWTTRDAVLDGSEAAELREQILVARERVPPDAQDVETQAREEVRRRMAEGVLPPELGVEEALGAARRHLRQRLFSVSPGGRTEWTFTRPRPPRTDRPQILQFRFEKSVMDLEPVQGRWTFGDRRAGNETVVAGAWRPQAVHSLPVPDGAWDASGRLLLGFENTDAVPTLLLFHPDDGLALLLYRGGFAANYVRTLAVLFFRLAFFAALGLAAGTLLSLPVAAFTSASFAMFILLSEYIEGMARAGSFFGTGPEAGLWSVGLDHVFALVFRLLSWIVQPLRGVDPLDWLAGGRWVAGSLVMREALIQGVLYAGVLGLVCAGLFRRRELGLPT